MSWEPNGPLNKALFNPYFLGGWHWGVPLDSHDYIQLQTLEPISSVPLTIIRAHSSTRSRSDHIRLSLFQYHVMMWLLSFSSQVFPETWHGTGTSTCSIGITSSNGVTPIEHGGCSRSIVQDIDFKKNSSWWTFWATTSLWQLHWLLAILKHSQQKKQTLGSPTESQWWAGSRRSNFRLSED